MDQENSRERLMFAANESLSVLRAIWKLAFAASLMALVCGQGIPAVAADPPPAVRTFVIPIDGPIEPSTRSFLERRLAEVRNAGGQCVVLDIDSPGGRLDTTLEITSLLRESTDLKTVAYIRRQALSGAALIALACNRIEMHAEAQLGDVGVIVGGPFSPYQYVPEKEMSAVVAAIRTLAIAGGRPAALAEAMVDKDITVVSATNVESGEISYFTNKEWESLANQDQWQMGAPVFEAREKHFLTVSGVRAVELGLAEQQSRSLDATLDNLGALRPARVLAWTWVDSTIELLNGRVLTLLLLFAGFVALLMELTSPGFGLGGLTAFFCFAIFFWSRFLGGTAGWLEVTLFVVALSFIAAEFFVLPGFGVAGITGIGLLILSLVMASRRVFIPQSGADWGDLGLNLLTVCAALLGVLIFIFVAADYLGSVPLFKRLVLEPPSVDAAAGSLTAVGAKKGESLAPWDRVSIGDLGRSISPLRPSGKALFGDDLLDVNTEGEFVSADRPVRVLRKQGIRITVREA